MEKDFRKNDESRLLRARVRAIKEMKKHGLMKGKNPWQFTFNNGRTILGLCDPNNREIQLSRYWVMSIRYVDTVDVILHEIAHALAGCEHAHNSVWKKKCVEIGARPERCYSGEFLQKRFEIKYNRHNRDGVRRFRVSH